MDVPRYVVTGAGGFVGTGLVRRLAARVPVLAMGRALPPALPQAARAIAADIAEPLANVPEFQGATVVHAAAVMNAADDEVYWRANVTGTFHALDWARRHDAQQFIFFSTGGVYPYARGVRHRETDRLEPIGFYGHTKYLGEELTRAFHTLHQLPVTVVRLFFPFGTGQRRGMMKVKQRP